MSLVSLLKMKNNKTLFTTPSHSGNLCIYHKFYQWYRRDISEVDSLNPQKELKQAEKKAALIYQTRSTHFLINGATSGVLASILTCCKKNDKILIWEEAHSCHKNGANLAGANIIEYSLPYDEEWGIYKALTPEVLRTLLKKYSPKAIVITSPTYEGIVSDVEVISGICRENGVYLIVDEAHGALYSFSDNLPKSAVKYADFTVQSLHKTAGGLNPTALLHSNCDLSPDYALNMINTTSPSYPMLATIEANIRYLNSGRGRCNIENLIKQINYIKTRLKNIQFYGDDPTKILIKKEGLSGYDLSEMLYEKFHIEDERTNAKSTMLLTGLGTNAAKLERLKKALIKIDQMKVR